MISLGSHEPTCLNILASAIQVLLHLRDDRLTDLPLIRSMKVSEASQTLGLVLLGFGRKLNEGRQTFASELDVLGVSPSMKDNVLRLEPMVVNLYYN